MAMDPRCNDIIVRWSLTRRSGFCVSMTLLHAGLQTTGNEKAAGLELNIALFTYTKALRPFSDWLIATALQAVHAIGVRPDNIQRDAVLYETR